MRRINVLKAAYILLAWFLVLMILFMTWNKSPIISLQELNLERKVIEIQRTSIQAPHMERQAAISDFCKKNNRADEPVDTKKLDHIIVNEKFKILFCYIPKVACTQWKGFLEGLSGTGEQRKAIMEILNHGDTMQFHYHRNVRFLSQYPRDEAERMLKSYFKVVFVRQPFVRFLSAYVSKFAKWNPFFYNLVGRQIIKRYRPGNHQNDKNVTFDEFVQHAIDTVPRWNEHWQTYDMLCHPCAIHYDFIGKFENLAEEALLFLETSGISKKLNVSFPHVKPSKTSSQLPLYYSQIPKERLSRIVQLLASDSEMFQYDLPKFLRDIMTGTD